jgi:hypothetical protein
MGRKIFISYKYGDSDVYPIGQTGGWFNQTTARNYVDRLESLLDANDHIYKGENDNESLAGFKDETIESKLRAKIFDTTVTLLLISKNMKDPSMSEDEQWIPWELSYSLKEMKKGNKTSKTNALLAVVLPDTSGSYEHFVRSICQAGCLNWGSDSTFSIISKNMFNRKKPKTTICANYHATGGPLHTGNDHSYIYPVKWSDFISCINGYIDLAVQINTQIDDYEITKIV